MGAASVDPAPLMLAAAPPLLLELLALDDDAAPDEDDELELLEPQAATPAANATAVANALMRRILNFISLVVLRECRGYSTPACYRVVNARSGPCERSGARR